MDKKQFRAGSNKVLTFEPSGDPEHDKVFIDACKAVELSQPQSLQDFFISLNDQLNAQHAKAKKASEHKRHRCRRCDAVRKEYYMQIDAVSASGSRKYWVCIDCDSNRKGGSLVFNGVPYAVLSMTYTPFQN